MIKMESLKLKYQEIIEKKKSEIKGLNKFILGISIARIFLFILICIILYHYWSSQTTVAFTVLIGATLFISLIRIHNRLYDKKNKNEKIVFINQQELNALNGHFEDFPSGEEFIDPDHFYSLDLDVFGKNSLFQLINRTSTPIGKTKLAEWFNNHLMDKSKIEERQKAIKELTNKVEFRQAFQLIGLSNEKQLSEEDLNRWMEQTSYKKNKKFRGIPLLVAIVNILMFILVILHVLPISLWVSIFFAFIVLNAFLISQIKTKPDENSEGLMTLSTYASLFNLIEKESFNSEMLVELSKSCFTNGKSPSLQLKKILNFSDSIKQRSNILIALILNGFFLWEFNLMLKIEFWKNEHQIMLSKWSHTLSQFDALSSLANFSYNHPNYTFPKITEHQFTVSGKNIGHPLMINKKCITNPINMETKGSFIVITGANMAGKSTFLRAVGINFLLACTGSAVFADTLTVTPNQLITSLRTSDSLAENESYFFAELKRLKMIVHLLLNGTNLFIILDEILKGTNSKDKLEGSVKLIEQLLENKANGLIATHDIELTDLEFKYPRNIKNFCFESSIENGELSFDYKLKEGVVKNMNACFLMEKMGIIKN